MRVTDLEVDNIIQQEHQQKTVMDIVCVCLSLAEQSVTVSVSPYLVLPD